MNEQVYDKAVKLLSRRMHTRGELRHKLSIRGFVAADIREVLAKLEAQKFLDDREFAESFAEELKRRGNLGYYGIKARLLKRLVPQEIAEAVLAQTLGPEEEAASARNLLAKFKKTGSPDDWPRLARALYSRGFRSEIIRQVSSHLP